MITLLHKLVFIVIIGMMAGLGPRPVYALSATAAASRAETVAESVTSNQATALKSATRPSAAGVPAAFQAGMDRCRWIVSTSGGGGGGGGGGQEFIAPASASSSAVLSRLKGHKDAIAAIEYSPDGRLIATSDANDVRLWDASGGNQLFVLSDPEGISSLMFSPDSRWVVTRSGEGTVRLWDTSTGRATRTLADGTVAGFSPDSRTVAIAGDGAVTLYNVKTGASTRVLENASPPVSFSPDGKIVAAIVPSDEAFGSRSFRPEVIVLWNAATGARLRELGAVVRPAGIELVVGEKGHVEVGSMVFSADGKRLLSSGNDADARLWDVATGRHLRCFRTDGYPDLVPTYPGYFDNDALLFDLDGKLLAAAPSGPWIYVWNAGANRIEQTIEIPFFAYELSSPHMTLSLDPQEPRLLTWYGDSMSKPGRTALVWDLVSAQLTGVLRNPGWLTAAALSPDANRATIAHRYDVFDTARTEIRGEGEAWIWDLDHGDVTLAAASGEFLLQGLAAAARKEPGAANLLRKAQALNPDPDFLIEPAKAQRAFAGALVTMGTALARTGDLKAATSKFEQALNLDPALGIIPKTEANQAYAIDLKDRGDVLARIGDYEAAVANYQQAIALDPSLQIDPELDAGWEAAQAFIGQGQSLAQAGDIEGAAAKFGEAQLLAPTLFVSPEERAKHLFDAARAQDLVAEAAELAQAGDLEGAADTYRQALALDPLLKIEPDQESRTVYGRLLVQQGYELAGSGDTEGATAKFEQALSIDPATTVAPSMKATQLYAIQMVNQGDQLALAGDLQGATTKYQQALAIDPTWGSDIEWADPKWADLDLRPKLQYATSLQRTGWVLARAGNLNNAIATYRYALEFDPTLDINPVPKAKGVYAGTHVEKGNALAQGGDLEGAAATYKRALALDPTLTIEPEQEAKAQYASAIVDAATLLARDGRIERAVAQYRAARRLDPTLDIDPVKKANQKRADVLFWRAGDLASHGSLDRAVEKYQEALVLDPTLDINPETKAWEEYAGPVISAAASLVMSGVDDAAAVTYLEQAVELIPSASLSDYDLKNVCWWGSLLSRDPKFLVACDEAVARTQDDTSLRVRRALARALTGDFSGAIDDFQYAIQQDATRADSANDNAVRQDWIQLLQSGADAESIFSPSMLKNLRQWN